MKLIRFRVNNGKIKYLSEEEFQEVYNRGFKGLKIPVAWNSPDRKERSHYIDIDEEETNPDTENSSTSEFCDCESSNVEDSLQQQQTVCIQEQEQSRQENDEIPTEDTSYVLARVVGVVNGDSEVKSANTRNQKAPDPDVPLENIIEVHPVSEEPPAILDVTSDNQVEAESKNPTEQSPLLENFEQPPDLGAPYLKDKMTVCYSQSDNDSEMGQCNERLLNDENNNDSEQCPVLEKQVSHEEVPESRLTRSHKHVAFQPGMNHNLQRLMWCKICDTYYDGVKGLREHIEICHHRDASIVNRWNYATWDLQIGMSLNPPSEEPEEEIEY